MLAAGWVDEARELAALGHLDTRPFASVGYKQVALALQSGGVIDLDELELSIFRATRVFARRQRTWLRDQAHR
jgi:tRNA dimethylallyltransferase